MVATPIIPPRPSSCRVSQSAHDGFGDPAGLGVHGQSRVAGVVQIGVNPRARRAVQGFGDDCGNIEKAQTPVKEGTGRDLVGGVEHGRGRTARLQRLARQTQGRKAGLVRRLEGQATQKGMELDEVGFYLDFFRYGAPPHGGFGMGLARLLMLLLGQESIREVTFLFRGPTRLAP